jgi:hypothetical protein
MRATLLGLDLDINEIDPPRHRVRPELVWQPRGEEAD